MNANGLLHYLTAVVELNPTGEPPSKEAWARIRSKIEGTTEVETYVVQNPAMQNPMSIFAPGGPAYRPPSPCGETPQPR